MPINPSMKALYPASPLCAPRAYTQILNTFNRLGGWFLWNGGRPGLAL